MAGFVLSVGYERRSIESFLQLLASYGVAKVVDVRELPASRKPGFSKRALSAYLQGVGIEYQHLRSAGNPFRKLSGDLEKCLELYASHLCDNPDVVELLENEVESEAVAVLCYERLHDACHRSVLLSALSQQNSEIHVIRAE